MAFVPDLAQDYMAADPPAPRVKTSIETASGTYFDLLNPQVADVKVADIAKALSNICRFGGHVSKFTSVAEHCCLVKDIVYAWDDSSELGRAALHHDSPETYYGDITSPLKALLGEVYREIRDAVDAAVGEALGIDPALFHHPIVKKADRLAMFTEAKALKVNEGAGLYADHVDYGELPLGYLKVHGWEPRVAEEEFLYDHWRMLWPNS